MSPFPLPSEPPTVPPDAWSALPGDLQQRAVRLLTRLAFAQFRQHSPSTTQETCYDRNARHPQDPAGPP
jgi:hypothetical protein